MRIRTINGVMLTSAMLTVISCGAFPASPAEKVENADAIIAPMTPAQEVAVQKEYSALPKGVLVRVAVDDQGKESTDSAEIRSVETQDLTTSTDAEKIWTSGKVANELDQDSSTQSYNDTQIQSYQLNLGNGNQQNGNQQNGNQQNGNQQNGNQQNGNQQNGNQQNGNQQNGNQQNGNQQNSYGRGGYGQGGYGQGGYGQGGYNQGGYGQGGYNQGGYYNGGFYRGYRVGYQAGYQNSYYSNYYRPAWYSQAYYGGYWGYNSNPSCYNVGAYRYYYYQRPSCSVYSWCGQTYY